MEGVAQGLWGCHLRNTAEDLGVRAVAGVARFAAVSSGGRAREGRKGWIRHAGPGEQMGTRCVREATA